jgi:hypothetical protein
MVSIWGDPLHPILLHSVTTQAACIWNDQESNGNTTLLMKFLTHTMCHKRFITKWKYNQGVKRSHRWKHYTGCGTIKERLQTKHTERLWNERWKAWGPKDSPHPDEVKWLKMSKFVRSTNIILNLKIAVFWEVTSCHGNCLKLFYCSLPLLSESHWFLYHEDGGSIFLQNIISKGMNT